MTLQKTSTINHFLFAAFSLFLFVVPNLSLEAATLKISPGTGVYTVGQTFTVSVLINTDGKSINAADGKITFNPQELQVTSVTRSSSIFNLWTEEPTFSNSAGTISFGGGSPTGYKGSSGSIVTISVRPRAAGTAKMTLSSGSVLAADGLGTNILTSMAGSSFTITAQNDSPAPEYIPPPNTPKAPEIKSSTHPNQDSWYKEKTAQLSWPLPDGVIAIRTLLDTNPGSIPTIVYDTPLGEKTIEDLTDGVTYFHLQFKNADGWGRVAHYALRVDTKSPENFLIKEAENSEDAARTLYLEYEDVSPVITFLIKIDANEPYTLTDEEEKKQLTLEPLAPGYHTVSVEAFDAAGNSSIATHALTITAFEKPVFTEYPTRIHTEVIPAILGTTKPDAWIFIKLTDAENGSVLSNDEDTDTNPFRVKADSSGKFVFIPNVPFEPGVYTLDAIAVDAEGRRSEKSDEIKIVVDKPGYIVLGAYLVNILSVIIPLVALTLLLVFGTSYLYHRLRTWRRKVLKETKEAEESLKREFHTLVEELHTDFNNLRELKKGKITKQEEELYNTLESNLKRAREKIRKEIEDIENVIL